MVTEKKSSDKQKTNIKGSSGPIHTINPDAAGIDIGSQRHYVAVGPDKCKTPVRSFGCYTPDLEDMAKWLLECGITTVAMESTGVYWIPVFEVLKAHGLEVILADAKHVKHVPGRKTDVSDCQWIQQLHSYGLIRSCFLPQLEISVLRQYWRHRSTLVESASREILRMQKALEQMNLQLHKVLSDITGVSGMRIIRAILSGVRNPSALAGMRDSKVKKSEDEIAKALSGNYREEHLFTLKHSVELYDLFAQKIRECDEKIEEYLKSFEDKADPDQFVSKKTKPKTRRKNQPHFELDRELYRVTGVDLTAIDGIDSLTAQTVVSEVGFDVSVFPTEKHFASWLTFSPDNRITGGKVRRRRTRKSQNRLATALRLAAQSLHKSDSALGAFFRRMKAKLGPAKAITATARKLACLIYRMLRYGMSYVDAGQQEYEKRYKEQQLRLLQNRAAALGYNLVSVETGEVS